MAKLIKMLTDYRHFYKAGEIVLEDNEKAKELVDLKRAEYVESEKAAPVNKEVQTDRKVGTVCDACGRSFASERGLKMHRSKSHS